jgi:hypothetical protein
LSASKISQPAADVTAASADHETDAVDIEGSARTDDLLRHVEDAGYEAAV